MKKALKITAITILLVILSPIISVLMVIAVVILLCRKNNMERFDEYIHKLTKGTLK